MGHTTKIVATTTMTVPVEMSFVATRDDAHGCVHVAWAIGDATLTGFIIRNDMALDSQRMMTVDRIADVFVNDIDVAEAIGDAIIAAAMQVRKGATRRSSR